MKFSQSNMVIEKKSKNKKGSFFIIFFVILLCGIFIWKNVENPGQIYCNQEVKICPDGSSVARTGPDCEFAECPSGFGNDQVGQAIVDYFLSQESFSWKTRTGSHNFCAVENLKPEKELFPLYVWVYCGEYIIEDGELKTLSGSSGPAKINYPNELSFYGLSRFSHEVPGDGSYYAEDVKRIFPEDVQQKIFDFDRKNIIGRTEESALINILAWEDIRQAVAGCEAEAVWQMHGRKARVELKNGEELSAVEPEIGDIIRLAEDAESNCGKILIGME